MSTTYFDQIGGQPCIEKVHSILYDKLLSHRWLKGFFVGMERWHLEEQQTHFMSDLFGGMPKIYQGRPPMRGHQHLFITEEVFMIRHALLAESLTEAKVPADLHEQWLKYDLGMKAAIVKETVEDCEGRFKSEEVLVVPKPQ
jgi:hemoglobin